MKPRRLMAATVAVLAVGSVPTVARAQRPGARVTIKEETPGLMARAKISGDSAMVLARKTVPKGRIVAAELEEENGKLIYSFDLRVPGEPGIFEVNVDAATGEVAPVERENAEETGAGGAVKIVEEHPGLAARAKISGDSATALARAAVPNGTITKAELEEEGGKLMYSFALTVPGRPGAWHVEIDGLTGAVSPVKHETNR
jgi:uncharacterized membrane protein YkoI